MVGSRAERLEVVAGVPTVREVVRHFVAALREDAAPPISLAEGLRAIAIVDACYASARAGAVAGVEAIDAP